MSKSTDNKQEKLDANKKRNITANPNNINKTKKEYKKKNTNKDSEKKLKSDKEKDNVVEQNKKNKTNKKGKRFKSQSKKEEQELKKKEKSKDINKNETKNKEENKKTKDKKKMHKDEIKEEVVKSEENTKIIRFEEIKNIFKNKKKIPKKELKKIHKPMWKNIIIAVVVIIYFAFLILGFQNIENSIYQTDLKVFALCILAFAIILLEKAYKEDNGTIALFGIEAIILAVVTLALLYVNLMISSNYINILLIISGVVLVYYIIKALVVNKKGRKKYFLKNVKEMINTDE